MQRSILLHCPPDKLRLLVWKQVHTSTDSDENQQSRTQCEWGRKVWPSRATNTNVFVSHCPKLNQVRHRSGVSELKRRICPRCEMYYSTLKALQAHRSQCENVVFTTVPDELVDVEDTEFEHIILDAGPTTAEPAPRTNVFERLNQMFGI